MVAPMNRYTAWIAALTGVACVFSNPLDAHAATKKKKPSADSSDDDSGTPAPRKKSTPPLELPLPAKKATDGATPAPAGDKAAEKTGAEAKGKDGHAPNATVEPEEIAEFAAQPPRIQQLLRDAIDLTRLNLTYTFGSADPDSGGMDCSGTICYLLH